MHKDSVNTLHPSLLNAHPLVDVRTGTFKFARQACLLMALKLLDSSKLTPTMLLVVCQALGQSPKLA